jgi:hypothetical protein
MINWVKEKWMKNLIFVCVFITLFSCIAFFPQISQSQQTNLGYLNISSSKVSPPQPITESPSLKPSLTMSSTLEDVSILSSAQLIQLAITSEEIMLREQQVKIAKQIEENAQIIASGPGYSGPPEYVLQATYNRLNSEIQLLQAKELLKLKQQKRDTASKTTSSKDI